MIFGTRSWRNWQTHYLEVVAGQPMEVQILSSAAKQAREFHPPEAKRDWTMRMECLLVRKIRFWHSFD